VLFMGGVGYHIALMRSKAAAGATQLYYRTVLAPYIYAIYIRIYVYT